MYLLLAFGDLSALCGQIDERGVLQVTRTLMNTLFVQTQGSYLSLDHETIQVKVDGERKMQIPMHHIGGIVLFGNVMMSPFLVHRCAADGRHIIDMACSFVEGKIRGARHVTQRAYRDYKDAELKKVADDIGNLVPRLYEASTVDEVRGIEGAAASQYFKVFSKMLRNPDVTFSGRTRRPPRDPVNAVLSFVYSMLKESDFNERPGGAVLLDDEGRKTVVVAYQERKQDEVTHPLFEQPVPIGLLPYIQARVLARRLRGDIDEYVAYRWR